MTNILDSVKCEDLYIRSQSLSNEETRALVRAMESGVEVVQLGDWGEVSLDISALTQYCGRGKCGLVACYDDTAGSYWEEVRHWAHRISWDVVDINRYILIKRK